MALNMKKLFALKDCLDLKIYDLSEVEQHDDLADAIANSVLPKLEIEYLNKTSFSLSSESVFAKKKGLDTLAFSSGRTGELVLTSELTNFTAFGMQLGGKVGVDKIEVDNLIPNTHYIITGTFRFLYDDSTEGVGKITFYKAKPKADCSVDFDSENVASFELKFDLLANKDGKTLTIEENI